MLYWFEVALSYTLKVSFSTHHMRNLLLLISYSLVLRPAQLLARESGNLRLTLWRNTTTIIMITSAYGGIKNPQPSVRSSNVVLQAFMALKPSSIQGGI